MQNIAAAVTMVRDDAFFLERWVSYYGDQFGRENLYVISHGRGEDVARIAQGCNIIGIPGDPDKNFDNKRWRLLNNTVAGLRNYFKHVLVGDVDEYVVMDPERFPSLLAYLTKKRPNRVLTPIGLEIVHRREDEPEAIRSAILGPRRFVQVQPHYAKPCIVSTNARISRGGHFCDYPDLEQPEGLYLFHMKFCDFGLYKETMDRRNDMVRSVKAENFKDAMIGRHWFPEERTDDKNFAAFDRMPIDAGFDTSAERQEMFDTWAQRFNGPFFEFSKPNPAKLYTVPARFHGIV